MSEAGLPPLPDFAGDRGALARAVSRVEAGGDEARALLDAAWRKAGRARRIGLTGPPGAGKSTLLATLVPMLRGEDKTVGVVAVDPSSPYTGGALLGDRHRMAGSAADDGVFVRSVASRGAAGGLARAVPAVLDLLDAAGLDVLCVETVGVGQTEMDIAALADTVVVVLSPESGDGVQAMKAGLLEIADVLCVNKADRPGAETLASELEQMLDRGAERAWRPPVLCTEGRREAGPLREALGAHADWLREDDRLPERRRRGLEQRLQRLFVSRVADHFLERAGERLKTAAVEVAAGSVSVETAAARLAKEFGA